MDSAGKSPFARLALGCMAAAIIIQPQSAAQRDAKTPPETRLARALGSGEALVSARRIEALLPEMIRIEETPGLAAGARRVRVTFEPKLQESARIEIQSEDPGLSAALARLAPAGLARAGDAPVAREIEWAPAAGAKAATLRAGLIFLDESGRVSMTAHREFELGAAEEEPAAPAAAPTIATDSRGATAAVYPAEAPAPRVKKREAR